MSKIASIGEPRIVFDLDGPPLIPAAKYELAYRRHVYTSMFKGRNKLEIVFAIVAQGPYFETEVSRYYNIRKIGRNYRPPKSGDLQREMIAVLGKTNLKLGIPWEMLKTCVIEGEIVTVTKDAQGRELAEENQYSKVARLIRKVQ